MTTPARVLLGLTAAAAVANCVAVTQSLLKLEYVTKFCSDALLAWYRFVAPISWGRPANMAAYHAGQALLVLSLAH